MAAVFAHWMSRKLVGWRAVLPFLFERPLIVVDIGGSVGEKNELERSIA